MIIRTQENYKTSADTIPCRKNNVRINLLTLFNMGETKRNETSFGLSVIPWRASTSQLALGLGVRGARFEPLPPSLGDRGHAMYS